MELYNLYLNCACRVTTDSRAIEGGEIFFALRGENFDGNSYAMQALEKGAAYAVVNEDAGFGFDPRLIQVADPFTELQQLAIHHRNNALGDRHLPVIGLTGTNGKTTTKELINAVLSTKYKVTATKGNLNNDIGVPLSLLSIRPDTEIAVIEMGANHPDDIAKLVKVSQPDYGLITNVGKAHLLGFGSFEGVKAAKGELYNWLGSHRGSLIFLNEDDADLREMAAHQPCHCFGYGMEYNGAKLLQTTADSPYLGLKIGDREVHTQLVGAYNANNVLAALCVGEFFGVSKDAAIAAIEAYAPANKRSQMAKTEKNTLIEDMYNANPSSMNAALDNFASISADQKLALLGDMRELGADSVSEHEKVLRKLEECGIPAYLVGEEFRKAIDNTGISVKGWFENSEALASHLAANPVEGAVVLIKGSRGIAMEKVLPAL